MDDGQWFGLFQRYRPHGDGVDEVFTGLPDAREMVERLHSVYRATFHEAWAEDGYFVVRTPMAALPEELQALGLELVSGLQTLARTAGRGVVQTYLARVTEVAVVRPSDFDPRHDDNLMVHDDIGDALGEVMVSDDPVVRLREAYYSIACDYWLANYLQWPYFRRWFGGDIFRPYFVLWTRGYRCAFRDEALCLSTNT